MPAMVGYLNHWATAALLIAPKTVHSAPNFVFFVWLLVVQKESLLSDSRSVMWLKIQQSRPAKYLSFMAVEILHGIQYSNPEPIDSLFAW
ncbi:hypothetical protein TNCV_916201 [Trichonephila clavipes]|nr:hypothetical protein TNCV_916201 [Trichonephila clavipes]